jgi:Lsr2
MAQKVLVQLVDDLDGTTSTEVETVQFGLDGATYEIDLSESNAQRLRKTVAEYIDAARRTGGRLKRGTRIRGTSAADGEAGSIREWAQANGIEVAARGRIPGDVVESYRQAQAAPTPATRKRGSRTKRK